jgi:hypothetical protein
MSYVTEVADLFLSRCRNVKILSPMDYATIAEWEKQEIPLTVVFNSLNRVFDNLPHNIEPVDIVSIGHFQNEVKKNFADWLHNLKNG